VTQGATNAVIVATVSEVGEEAVPFRPRQRGERFPRTNLDPFPRMPLARWMLRLLFALPLLATAIIVYVFGQPIDATPNATLVERVSAVQWDRADPDWLGQIYPPISTLLATFVPGGRFGLAVLGALAGGIFLQKLAEILVQREFHRSTSVILMIALAANPLFLYTATENVSGFLGLMFFGLATADMVRFFTWGNTQSGFRAGLSFMMAALTDLTGFLFVVTALITAPFLRLRRNHQRGARWANVLVIVYPTAASIGALMLLNVAFLSTPIGAVGDQVLAGAADRFAALPAQFSGLTGWLLIAPVLSAWLCALLVGRFRLIPVSALVFLGIVGAEVAGLVPAGSVGNTYILMTVLAIALIPSAKSRLNVVLLNAVAFLQLLIAWAVAFDSPTTLEWMMTLRDAFG